MTPTLALLRRWFFGGDPASVEGATIDHLYMVIFWVSTVVFVFLMAMMVYFAFFKYRRRPGRGLLRSASHNTPLELAWSILPTIVLVWFFFEGFWGYARIIVAPVAAPEIVITARQWSWSAAYPNGAGSPLTVSTRFLGKDQRVGPRGQTASVLPSPVFIIPEGRPVKFRMSSTDVIHSFWIPDFRVKFDVFPNRYTNLWIEPQGVNTARAEANGWVLEGAENPDGSPVYYNDHWVFCAEYCGDNHSEMYAVIRVLPAEHFNRILADWAEPKGTPVEKGRALSVIKGCIACHNYDQGRNVGPGWGNMFGYDVPLADGRTITADEDYIRRSILEPSKEIHRGYPNQMPPYQGQLTDDQLNSLVAFIIGLSDRAPPGFGEEQPEPEAGEGAELLDEPPPAEQPPAQQPPGTSNP